MTARAAPPAPTCSPRRGPARVVIALGDPDPRTDGDGIARLRGGRDRGRDRALRARRPSASMAGFLTRIRLGRPFVTLKLAMSIDGRIALASGESQWITGEEARAHAHLERAPSRHDPGRPRHLRGRRAAARRAPARARGPLAAPRLADHAARRVEGWTRLGSPQAIRTLADVNDLLVEGGAETAAAFLAADLVDRLLVYRAPILIGEGKAALGDDRPRQRSPTRMAAGGSPTRASLAATRSKSTSGTR